MDRRAFLQRTLKSAAALSALGGCGSESDPPKNELPPPPIALVSGGEPEALFDGGIAALGGIGAFVSKNQTVAIKPNAAWDQSPSRSATTNPQLVGQIVRQCVDAGAKKVYVFDHTVDDATRCYANTGIGPSVLDAGGEIMEGNNHTHFHRVEIPKAERLLTAHAHELFLEADVFINVPVLKNHIATKISCGMKNLMGVVLDRPSWHTNDLHQCVADFATVRVPTLTVVDAYRISNSTDQRDLLTTTPFCRSHC